MLPSTHIADVEKSMRYAQESNDRIVFDRFAVTMVGDHRKHQVSYDKGSWSCDCEGYQHHGYCSHTMTMERVLGEMVRLSEIVMDEQAAAAEG
jgi:hypothetical protein